MGGAALISSAAIRTRAEPTLVVDATTHSFAAFSDLVSCVYPFCFNFVFSIVLFSFQFPDWRSSEIAFFLLAVPPVLEQYRLCMLSRYHPRVYMYTYNIGRREKESKIVNMAKTILRRLLLFISGCYGCNEHAHQFLLAQGEKKKENLGREGLSSDGAFDFEWQRKSESPYCQPLNGSEPIGKRRQNCEYIS